MYTAKISRNLFLLAALMILSPNLSCTQQKVGGPCTYSDFVGTATITELKPHEDGSDDKGYWVTFDTELTGKDKIPVFYTHQGRVVLVKNPNGKTDTEWLSAQGVSVNAKLDLQASIITSGTCTPVMFKFPTLPAGIVQD